MSGLEVRSSIQKIIVAPPASVTITPGVVRPQTIDARPNAGISIINVGPPGPPSNIPGPPGPKGDPGETGAPGSSGATSGTYIHNQSSPSDTWVITHNLGFYPAVTVIDSGGSMVEGDVKYDSLNQVTLSFSGAFSGVASFS